MESLNLNPPNLTKSDCFNEILYFLEGPKVLKLLLVNRDFYDRIVPEYIDKEGFPLTTHDGTRSLIFKDSATISSLLSHLGQQKIIEILWRGSRDGFGACIFHQLCDHKGKTLTVVKTKSGSVFGGFTDTRNLLKNILGQFLK